MLNIAPVFCTRVQNISKKVLGSGWAPTRLLISQVKNWFRIWTVIVHECISQEWKNTTCQRGANVVTMSSGGRGRHRNWKDFLPNGVCMYKYAHEQSCLTFCTGFITWLWFISCLALGSSRCWAHLELWEVLCTPLSPPGCWSCDDGLGPPGFDDRTAFCLFSLITVVWGCYLCVLSSGIIVLSVTSFSWHLL